MLRRGLTPCAARRRSACSSPPGVLVKTQVIAFAPGVALALLVAARWRTRAGGLPWRPLAAAAGAGARAARRLRRARRDGLGPPAARPRRTRWRRPPARRDAGVASWRRAGQLPVAALPAAAAEPDRHDPAAPPYRRVVQGAGRPLRLARLRLPRLGVSASPRRRLVARRGARRARTSWQRRATILRSRSGEPVVFAADGRRARGGDRRRGLPVGGQLDGDAGSSRRATCSRCCRSTRCSRRSRSARSGRRRARSSRSCWSPACSAHGLFAQLQTLVRFYG